MGTESDQYALPAELDTYLQESIFHTLGFCASEEHLNQKLAKAEESYRDLALQMQHVQLRLRELEYKRSKSKEEAVLSAQALKRQVAESQKLAEQHRALKEECSRLENECALYHNDRDVFMEAAYEAEDRAAEAEDKAEEAERKNETLIEELERLRKALAQDGRVTLEMDYTEYVASLKLRIAKLEEQNSRFVLQEEVLVLRAEGHQVMSAFFTESRSLPEEAALQVLLLEAKEKCEEAGRELISLQEIYDREAASNAAERAVKEMVSSAVTSGICKALEEENEALNAINLEFSSIFRCMESELGGSRERVKVAETKLQALLQETQSLRQEAALCRGNLDKAEVEVQMLADWNKELRVLLRRYAGPESPMQNKGNKGGRSQSGGRPRSKTYEGQGEESICALCDARQPLMPLPGNSQERKLNRRQNLTVDGNLYSRSPSSPSLENSPGSIFQD